MAKIGEVKQVKVLGIMAMIDDGETSCCLYSLLGETDWKVIGIDVTDPFASQMNGTPMFVDAKT